MEDHEMIPMPKAVRAMWLSALRSGEYVQGTHRLCRVTPLGQQYCCLGVACDLFKSNDFEWQFRSAIDCDGPYMEIGGKWGIPPETIQMRMFPSLHYDNSNVVGFVDALTELNDSKKWTFEEIASYIEAHTFPFEETP